MREVGVRVIGLEICDLVFLILKISGQGETGGDRTFGGGGSIDSF